MLIRTALLAFLAGCGPEPRGGAFVDVTDAFGLDFTHDAGMDGEFFLPEHLASGAALFDFDMDGDLDVLLLDGHPRGRDRLFERGADGRFSDVTEGSGLGASRPGGAGWGMAIAVGDHDNDGDPDVYVARYGPDTLLSNRGDGTFEDVTAAAGVADDGWSCAVDFVDYDADGWLDLFVTHYVDYSRPVRCVDSAGRLEYCGPKEHPATPDRLLHNRGDGTFEDVSDSSGIASLTGRALGLACEDFDGDGRVDLFVANDGMANFLWRNQGDGTFVEDAVRAGVATNYLGRPEASMGAATGDFDGDGSLDLFLTHLDTETNTCYLQVRPGVFRDQTLRSGLGPPSLAWTGFGVAAIDYDQDGWLDLAVANGRVRRGPDSASGGALAAAYAQPNALFRNVGGGTFEDAGAAAGDFARGEGMSRALAAGDIDGDGDLDLLVADCAGRARLYENRAATAGHWLLVRALDPALARDAYGARVTLEAGGRRQVRTIRASAGYAAAQDPRAHFGLGAADAYEALEVRWPDGVTQRFAGGPADRALTLERTR